MASLDEQLKENELEHMRLQTLKNEKETGLLARVMRVFAESACCDWTNQNIHRLLFEEESLVFGDGIRIGFPRKWSLFGVAQDLHKAGFNIEQISWGEENFMLVGENNGKA
jgi:hypothetical protein